MTYASENNCVNIIRLLLENLKIENTIINAALLSAAERGNEEIVELLLLDSRVDPATNNNSVIKFLAEKGSVKLVQLLLSDSRVDPTVDNNFVIDIVCINKHVDIMRLLLKDPRTDIVYLAKYMISKYMIFDYKHEDSYLEILKMLFDDTRVCKILDKNNMTIILKNGSYNIIKFYIDHPQINVFDIVGKSLFEIVYLRYYESVIELIIQDERFDLLTGIKYLVKRSNCTYWNKIFKLLLSDNRAYSIPVSVYKKLALCCNYQYQKKLLNKKIDTLEVKISYKNLDIVRQVMEKCQLLKIDINNYPSISYSKNICLSDTSNMQTDIDLMSILINSMLTYKIVKIEINDCSQVQIVFGN